MDEFELDPSMPVGKAMVAGATAGVMEHCFMYPVDTIKSLVQADAAGTRTIAQVLRSESVPRLYRGMGAVIAGAVPSHAVQFGAYEVAKEAFGGNREGHHPLLNGAASGLATMAHDAVVTPLDVVKQRMQVYPTQYPTLLSAIATTFRTHGLRGFYASYPVTVSMNIPHMAGYFATYESLKIALRPAGDVDNDALGPLQHMVAGAGAGALAGCLSTPLDVIKTRLQLGNANLAPSLVHITPAAVFSPSAAASSTSSTAAAAVASAAPPRPAPSTPIASLRVIDIVRSIHAKEGWKGFTRGMAARVLYFTPSAAICWTTYEAMKALLKD